MDETQRRVDDVRNASSELENHLIDEYSAARITRRDFVRRGTVLGMSLPLLSFLATACGGDEGGGGATTAAGQPAGEAKPGGTIRTAIQSPAGAIDPVTIADEGGLSVLGQSSEYLTFSNEKLELEPQLAESWEPNEDGTVWTFKLRQGVRYHDGGTVTAQDVVATFDRLSDPEVGSNALSALGGVLSKGSTRAVDDATVEFTLDAPNGGFPYLVSSDNYNAVILPANYNGDYDQTFPGTGPWRLERFQPNVGVTFVKNPDYWGDGPLADRSEIKFYDEEQPRVLALQGNQVDVLAHFSVSGGQAVLNDQSVNLVELRSSVHRQIHMRTDRPPFDDKRVRQAMALALDRKALVDGLLGGKADVGNDSPFAPVYPFTDTSVEQREQDVEQARQLVSEAGADGGSAEITTFRDFELPDLAVIIQNTAKEIGLNIRPNLMDQSAYYGDAVYGNSPWLDSVMGITDYGHRGVPNVFLVAPLTSKGTWNSAHFKNAEYDRLVTQYIAALDLESQRSIAGQIQRLLLDEAPIIFPYFYFYLFAVKKGFTGVRETAMGHIDLKKAGQAA